MDVFPHTCNFFTVLMGLTQTHPSLQVRCLDVSMSKLMIFHIQMLVIHVTYN